MSDLIKNIRRVHEDMAQERLLHENAWQEIGDLFMPFRGDVTTKASSGSERIQSVLDSVGMESADQLANFLYGNVFVDKWPRMFIRGADGFLDQENQMVAEQTTQRFLDELDNSNFYSQAGEFLRDIATAGTAAMRIRPDTDELVAESVWINEVYIQENERKQVDRVHWTFELTAEQALERWGERCPKDIRERVYAGDSCHKYDFLHAVFPRRPQIPWTMLTKTERPFASVIFRGTAGEDDIIEEEGFDFFPWVVGRWMQVAGETWGRGIGHKARPAMKCCNEVRRQIYLAIPLSIRPPLFAPHDSILSAQIVPGGVTTYRPGPFDAKFVNPQADFQAADMVLSEQYKVIKSAFLVDVIGEKDTEPRSAAESNFRNQRGLRRLMAPAARLQREFMTPITRLIFQTLLARGRLPEMAEFLKNNPQAAVDIQFQSPLLQAQREAALMPMQQTLQEALALAQATGDPAWLDPYKPDGVTLVTRQARANSALIYRTPTEINDLRDARAQAATQQQMQSLAETASKVAKNAPGMAQGFTG